MSIPACRLWGFSGRATPPGSTAYYALRFAPRARRDDLAAVYGWRAVLRAIPEQVTDRGVAAAKLHWWREELQRVHAGRPTHPLGECLAPLVARRHLPAKPFLDLAWSTEAVLAHHRARDFAELVGLAEQDLGALLELVLRAQGDDDPDRIARARGLGAYCSLVYMIRDSGALLRRGHVGIIPGTWLQALGAGPDDLIRPIGPHLMPRLLAGLGEKAAATRARAGDPVDLPVTARVEVRLADSLLAELAQTGFDLMDQRIALTPLHELWQGWRESRRRR